jgi:hypothetical protein
MVAQVGYSVVGRSRVRKMLCAVCTVHVEMKRANFLVEHQKQCRCDGLHRILLLLFCHFFLLDHRSIIVF